MVAYDAEWSLRIRARDGDHGDRPLLREICLEKILFIIILQLFRD